MGEKIRICKFLSMCGVASRRGADKLVEQGKVHINHRRAVLGDMVERGRDKVTVDGKPVGAETEPMVYICLLYTSHTPLTLMLSFATAKAILCVNPKTPNFEVA